MSPDSHTRHRDVWQPRARTVANAETGKDGLYGKQCICLCRFFSEGENHSLAFAETDGPSTFYENKSNHSEACHLKRFPV